MVGCGKIFQLTHFRISPLLLFVIAMFYLYFVLVVVYNLGLILSFARLDKLFSLLFFSMSCLSDKFSSFRVLFLVI